VKDGWDHLPPILTLQPSALSVGLTVEARTLTLNGSKDNLALTVSRVVP
jgi:hypothetical protein